MKRCGLIFILLLFILSFTSCASNPDKLDSVIIEGKEYKRAFIGEFYPIDDSKLDSGGVKVSGNSYYKYSGTLFDCYITYDRNAEPNIYFESEKFNEAVSHYADSNNFNFFCILGNIHDESDQQIFCIEKIDSLMFNSLLEFSKENEYNPFTFFNNEEGLEKVPIANTDDWLGDEIHFYKESKDGAFTTSQGYTFIFYENKLCFLYQYDFSNDDVPLMAIRDIPEELSGYFLSLLYQERILTNRSN